MLPGPPYYKGLSMASKHNSKSALLCSPFPGLQYNLIWSQMPPVDRNTEVKHLGMEK